MKVIIQRFLAIGLPFASLLVATLPVLAQVVPDNTLGTQVIQTGLVFGINNGTRSGSNLFHSFSQFSVPTSGVAIFNNATDVQNIFSRVTGNQISNIDGILKTQGGANLFLMNPNGIIFGPNARLELGGSFFGTTASAIKFEDGIEFNAANTTTPALLSVNVPIGLQMGSNPGQILVQGTGHTITRIGPSFLNRGNPEGLQVSAGKTLALVGRDIILDGGLLMADSGKIELAALSNGQWVMGQDNEFSTLGSTLTPQFGDIQLRAAALVDTSGLKAGSIQFRGRNITLQDGSIVLGQNFGPQSGQTIQILGSESLVISGTTPFVSSRISTQSLGSGQSGSINIDVPNLSISDGATVASATFGSAQSGDVTIHARDSIQMTGYSLFDPSNLSALTTATFGTGDSGALTVSTGTLTLRDGAQITSPTIGLGNAGRVTVNATNLIDLQGTSVVGNSAILSISLGQGNAGTTIVNTPRLKLRDGGSIFSIGFSSGNAGSIIVNAQDSIEIANSKPTEDILYSAQISSSIQPAGSLLQAILGLPSIATGKSGSIIINTPELTITNGASVAVGNQGPDSGGRIEINSKVVNLNNGAKIVALTASGNGGNIILNASDILLLRHNSELSTQSNGTGNGGDITIDSPIIVGLENSDIIANAVKGRGGNIQITTQSLFGLKYRPMLTPDNDITASSEFGINGNVQVSTIGINPANTLNSLPSEVHDSSRQIADRCGNGKTSSFIATGRGGMPQGPRKKKSSDRTWNDLRTNALQASSIVTPITQNTSQPIVEASAFQIDASGSIALVAPNPISAQTVATCGMAGSIGER
jgi:filamentous hemagglutinin family protein